MRGSPLHKIAAAIDETQRDTLGLLRDLERDGHVERVGTDRFWRLTASADSRFGDALRSLRDAA